jgi:hypothetical protein
MTEFDKAFSELEENTEQERQDALGIEALQTELKQAQSDYFEAKSRYEEMVRRTIGAPRS